MPLFVSLDAQQRCDEAMKQEITRKLKTACSPRHVPDEIIPVPEIPYTLTGKKLEVPVRKILKGARAEEVASRGSMRNPDSLDFFVDFYREKKHWM